MVEALDRWCSFELDQSGLRAKLRFIAIVSKNTLPAWRGEKPDWPRRFPTRLVVVADRLWCYLADKQLKATPSFCPERWGNAVLSRPERTPNRLMALRLARDVFELGASRLRRLALASRLVRLPEMRRRWFRALVRALGS